MALPGRTPPEDPPGAIHDPRLTIPPGRILPGDPPWPINTYTDSPSLGTVHVSTLYTVGAHHQYSIPNHIFGDLTPLVPTTNTASNANVW